MAHAERLQEYNCANAIVRLGGRYAPPEHVTVFRGTTDDNLRRSIDFARRPREGLHADLPPPAGGQRTCGRTE